MALSAAQQVAEITELRDTILAELSGEELLTAMLVNKAFHASITTSPTLLDHMGLISSMTSQSDPFGIRADSEDGMEDDPEDGMEDSGDGMEDDSEDAMEDDAEDGMDDDSADEMEDDSADGTEDDSDNEMGDDSEDEIEDDSEDETGFRMWLERVNQPNMAILHVIFPPEYLYKLPGARLSNMRVVPCVVPTPLVLDSWFECCSWEIRSWETDDLSIGTLHAIACDEHTEHHLCPFAQEWQHDADGYIPGDVHLAVTIPWNGRRKDLKEPDDIDVIMDQRDGKDRQSMRKWEDGTSKEHQEFIKNYSYAKGCLENERDEIPEPAAFRQMCSVNGTETVRNAYQNGEKHDWMKR